MANSIGGRHSMDSPEWYTPRRIIDAARAVLGEIDLDPASHPQANLLVGATRFYDEQDDGLVQPWYGRVFVNPPGGSALVNAFWTKFVAQPIEAGIWIGYSLEQLQTLQRSGASAQPFDFAVCLPSERIAFVENEAKKALRLAKISAENRATARSRGEAQGQKREKLAVARQLHRLSRTGRCAIP